MSLFDEFDHEMANLDLFPHNAVLSVNGSIPYYPTQTEQTEDGEHFANGQYYPYI